MRKKTLLAALALLFSAVLYFLPDCLASSMDQYVGLMRAGKIDEIIARAKADRDRDSGSVDAWLEYAYIATCAGALREARDAYAHVAKNFSSSTKASFAQAMARSMQSDIEAMPEELARRLSFDDYCLVDVAANHDLHCWDTRRLPLRVYLSAAPGIDLNTYSRVARQALGEWESGSQRLVRFIETADRRSADLTIAFTADTNSQSMSDRAGSTQHKYGSSGLLQHADITCITVYHRTNETLPLHEVRLTVAHELGHALGLGHSKDPFDMMCVGGSFALGPTSTLSRRDLQALRELYTIPHQTLYRRAVVATQQAGGARSRVLVKILDNAGFDARASKNSALALAWLKLASTLSADLRLRPDYQSARRDCIMANIYYNQAKYDLAAPLYRRYAATLKPTDPDFASTQRALQYCLSFGKNVVSPASGAR